jgi:uncharacterized membrane protein YdjX (TVP38/TMEM64 family)
MMGMTVGASIGFWAARKWGANLAARMVGEQDLRRLAPLGERFGPSLIVATRAIPAFAEAAVLLMGMHSLSWRRFLPGLLISNVLIAFAYSWFGDVADDWLAPALCLSAVVPIMLTFLIRRRLLGEVRHDI